MRENINRILGCRLDPVTMEDVLQWAKEHIDSGVYGKYINVLNVAKLVKAKEDPELFATIEDADLVGADGVPLVWLSRFIGRKLPERINGTDLMMELLARANREHWSIYFFGATEETAGQVIAKVSREYPHLRIAGYRNGYFDMDKDSEHIVELINAANANILFLGFGTPHKEQFVGKWKNKLKVNVIHGVGGSFDVYAGKVPRAPKLMQRMGLEWLYRMLQEPQRMFGRYFRTNTKFFYILLKEIFVKH